MTITVTVNGTPWTLEVQAHRTLLQALRDQLNLTGTKECCAEGECGACTVLLNGRAVNACLVLAVECDGEAVVTIEGLGADGRLDALQQAFVESGAVQCGFCIPGMIVAASYLLSTNPQPSEDEIKEGLSGNLCRCAGYSRIIEAVARAAQLKLSPTGATRAAQLKLSPTGARATQLSRRAQLKLSTTDTDKP
jgi:carbon-monoxide dehydrogenase small subunit